MSVVLLFECAARARKNVEKAPNKTSPESISAVSDLQEIVDTENKKEIGHGLISNV